MTDNDICLLVVAHPDDEILGLGGAAKLLGDVNDIHTCIMSGHAQARKMRPSDEELRADILQAHGIAGMTPSFFGGFPNIRMNTVPHLDLVQFIENAILVSGATRVYTHHPSDLNDDHKHVSIACQAAVRVFQRRNDVRALRGFYFMEVLSSTEWAFDVSGGAFNPTGFLEIGEEGVQRKLQALAAYRHVMREYPHPRSKEVISGLAALRGAQAGVRYAEAVQVVFERLR